MTSGCCARELYTRTSSQTLVSYGSQIRQKPILKKVGQILETVSHSYSSRYEIESD